MAQNDTIVSDLIFNSMSQAEFNAQMQAETLDPNQFYLTPDGTNEKFEEIDAKIDETVANIEELSARIDTYSDTEFIAHQAMPSNRYVSLTLPASGGTITAPADGFLFLSKNSTATGQRIALLGNNQLGPSVSIYSSNTGQALNAYLPVSTGSVTQIQYTADGTTNHFKFVYANGAK